MSILSLYSLYLDGPRTTTQDIDRWRSKQLHYHKGRFSMMGPPPWMGLEIIRAFLPGPSLGDLCLPMAHGGGGAARDGQSAGRAQGCVSATGHGPWAMGHSSFLEPRVPISHLLVLLKG